MDSFWEVIKLILLSTGLIKPQNMITKVIKLDRVAEEGFGALINDKANQVKVLIDVGAGI
jgi:threonine dehydrogenase-like Zn-dependent dehydrogenase